MPGGLEIIRRASEKERTESVGKLLEIIRIEIRSLTRWDAVKLVTWIK